MPCWLSTSHLCTAGNCYVQQQGLTRLHAAQVLESGDVNIGFNAATGKYEDLMAAGIIDPTKVCP